MTKQRYRGSVMIKKISRRKSKDSDITNTSGRMDGGDENHERALST